jgi:hypothetical protein
MTRLYSYCIPYDDGAAPNPYWGVCTLVICKPAIRRTAQVGDWVAGTGAKYARLADGKPRNMSGRLVYAMKITDKISMPDYDQLTRNTLPNKIPDLNRRDEHRHLGDSIYDFSGPSVVQRPGVHKEENAERDLSGRFALLSTHFLYFGAAAIELPGHLVDIAQNRQGHRVGLNDKYVGAFVRWVEGMGHKLGSIIGEPLLDIFANDTCSRWCAASRAEADEDDAEDVGSGCP